MDETGEDRELQQDAEIDITNLETMENGVDQPSTATDHPVNHAKLPTQKFALVPTDELDPPRSPREIGRDCLLALLNGRFFQALNVTIFLLIIVDGTFFFFLLNGWQSMCEPRLDCELRNWWYNWSAQVLTGLFTASAVMSLPWRWTNLLHTTGLGNRKNTPGHDLYGIPTNDVWFHIPLRTRLGIIIALLLNIYTQFANQASRIIFHTYELQSQDPATFWVTIFCILSFFCAAVGFGWMSWEGYRLRQANPGFFRDDPVDTIITKLLDYFGRKSGEEEEDDAEEDKEVEMKEERLQSALIV